MPQELAPRGKDSEESDATELAPAFPPLDDDTMTTEIVKVERGTDAPFSLPHVSELDEATPRDARNDPAARVTMPAYGHIARAPAERVNEKPTLLPVANGGPAKAPGAVPRVGDAPTLRQSQTLVGPPSPAPRQDSIHLARKPRRKRRLFGAPLGCIWVLVGLTLTFCGGLTLLTAGAAALFIPQVEAEWTARVTEIDNYRGFESSFIYDRYGNELYEAFGEGRRTRVSYEQIPDALILATIAIEDDSFFTNIGIDVGHTLLAALNYLGAADRDSTPGGSTITQQLARNVFFDFEKRAQRSVSRKAEEILLAIVLTQTKSKKEILEMYFNEIYYGNLAYGVQTAAQTFFGKDVGELNVGEAAMLAGLPQAPAWLDPLNPDPAVQAAVAERWRQVLGEMAEEGFISQQQVKQSLAEGLSFAPANVSLTAPHFTVYAQGELERLMRDLGYSPEDVAQGGLRVYTTLDQDVNRLAQRAAADQVAQLRAKNVSNAAVVVTKPASGEIMAMVGSIDYNNEAIDGSVNVTTAFRQPGSTMKPFTYSAAIESGLSSADVLWDTRAQIELPGLPAYTPRNFDNAFHGPMTMRTALANSYNIPAVQALRKVGVETLLKLLRRFGISTLDQDASNYGLSLTLGGGEVTLIELTNAFAVFANQGNYVPVTSLLCVIGRDDQILYQYEDGCPEGQVSAGTVQRRAAPARVLDPRVAFLITDILGDNPARSPAMGSYSPLRTDNIYAAVKTGTTDDVKDNWTIGYTRNAAVGVWVGNNDGDPMIDSSGLTGAAPIWNTVLTGIYGSSDLLAAFASDGQLLNDRPIPPAGMTLRQICDVRRLTELSIRCPATINEWTLDGPAGLPDGAGGLTYPPVAQRYPTPVPVQGSVLRELSPGVYQTLAYALPPEIAAGIQFQVGPGEKPPLPPNFCRVPVQDAHEALAAGAQNFIFIIGPTTSHDDAVEAERYAREQGLAYLPTVDCWPGVYSAGDIGEVGASLQIQQPAPGQSVDTVIPIIGTAHFNPGQAENYHFYIRGGQFADWTPLGRPHQAPVVQGQLETLHADALRPGNYVLRLALVRGGNIVQAADVIFIVP
ncbi:MAG: transglycosylase domain-containing protein [Chloroflexota bacterium]|nr:transglycosylase domain-containing protein [Chloroflexota bacterium]MDE2948644.1 transglycosylase domain-containing protein [Chloroflexota bacterium]